MKILKKYRMIAYIVLVAIIIVITSVIYVNANKNPEQEEKQKVSTELEFLEDKLVNLINMMNNIQTSKYNVTVKEIPSQSQGNEKENESSSQSQSEENNNQEENESNNKEQSGSQEQGNSQNSSSQNSQSESDSEENKKYELELNGILNENEQIDWENVKGDIEELYISIPTITLDLYKTNVNKDEILNFNKEYDNLIKVSKNENKQEVLDELNTLYSYIPKFVQNSTDDNINKTVIETKSYIISAYSKLDSENWDSINEDIKKAIDTYSKLLTDTNINKEKQYSLNKSYVILNEIQNAINIKDKSVFLIKYKNLLEELENV